MMNQVFFLLLLLLFRAYWGLISPNNMFEIYFAWRIEVKGLGTWWSDHRQCLCCSSIKARNRILWVSPSVCLSSLCPPRCLVIEWCCFTSPLNSSCQLPLFPSLSQSGPQIQKLSQSGETLLIMKIRPRFYWDFPRYKKGSILGHTVHWGRARTRTHISHQPVDRWFCIPLQVSLSPSVGQLEVRTQSDARIKFLAWFTPG